MTERKKMTGFTLYELMLTLGIAGILLAYGIPNFTSFMQNNRAAAHTNELVGALNYARSEATRTGISVRICSTTNGNNCNGGNDWTGGWIVRPVGGTVLRRWPALSGGANLVTGNVKWVLFNPRGPISGAATPQLQVRLPNCTGDQSRNVTVNKVGRVSTTRVTCP